MGVKIIYLNESVERKVKEGGPDRNNVIKVIIKYLKRMSDEDLDKILDYIDHLIT